MLKPIKIIIWNLILIALLMSACQPSPAMNAIEPIPSVPATDMPVPVPATPAPFPVASIETLWSFQTQGAVWGSPAVSDGTVYFGSDDGNLYAVEAQTGDLKWKFSTQGLVRSRPALSAGLVFIASDDGNLYAVDTQSAKQVWRIDIGNFSESEPRENPGTVPDPTAFDYLQSSPVLFEGQIYIGSADGQVYALEAASGDINWKFKTGQKVRASPVADNGTVYIGSWDGTVYALDALTGQARWQTPIGGQIQTTALVANGLVYTASRKASVVALDAQTGRKKWEYDYGQNQWVESSPKLSGNLIYIGSSGNQYILGLNSVSGELFTAYRDLVFFWSTPVISANLLYIGAETYTKNSEEGGLFCFEIPSQINFENRNPIKLKWFLPITDTLMPDGNWAGIASSPIISDGVIYFGGLDGKLYAVIPES
jgi:outer membrane protein assembly factor BamB